MGFHETFDELEQYYGKYQAVVAIHQEWMWLKTTENGKKFPASLENGKLMRDWLREHSLFPSQENFDQAFVALKDKFNYIAALPVIAP